MCENGCDVGPFFFFFFIRFFFFKCNIILLKENQIDDFFNYKRSCQNKGRPFSKMKTICDKQRFKHPFFLFRKFKTRFCI